MKRKCPHLSGLHFVNEDEKEDHPTHIILGDGDVAS